MVILTSFEHLQTSSNDIVSKQLNNTSDNCITMERKNLAMPEALRDRFKIIAAKEKMPMVDLIERWVVEYEKGEQVPPPKTAAELLKLKRQVRP